MTHPAYARLAAIDPRTIAERIRARLAELGWSQADLGRELDQKSSNVSRWLTGRGRPGIDNLIKIADALRTSVDALLAEER